MDLGLVIRPNGARFYPASLLQRQGGVISILEYVSLSAKQQSLITPTK